MTFQEVQSELEKTEHCVTQLNSDAKSQTVDQRLIAQLNDRWETLRSQVEAADSKLQMISDSFSTFTGELCS